MASGGGGGETSAGMCAQGLAGRSPSQSPQRWVGGRGPGPWLAGGRAEPPVGGGAPGAPTAHRQPAMGRAAEGGSCHDNLCAGKRETWSGHWEWGSAHQPLTRCWHSQNQDVAQGPAASWARLSPESPVAALHPGPPGESKSRTHRVAIVSVSVSQTWIRLGCRRNLLSVGRRQRGASRSVWPLQDGPALSPEQRAWEEGGDWCPDAHQQPLPAERVSSAPSRSRHMTMWPHSHSQGHGSHSAHVRDKDGGERWAGFSETPVTLTPHAPLALRRGSLVSQGARPLSWRPLRCLGRAHRGSR